MILYSDYMAEIPSGTVTTEKQREEKIIEMKTLTMTGINAPALRFVGVGDGAMVIDLDNAEGFKLAWLHIPACCSRVGINTPVISAIAIHGNCKVSSDYLNNTNALSVIRFDKDARENGIYSNSKAKTVLPAELSDCGLIDLEYETEAITAEHFGVQSSVKAIILPQSVKSISDNAFEGWGLENIVIPASVEKIGSNIFMDCIQLKSVVFESIPKMFGCDTFDGCSSLESIVIGGQTLSGDEFAEQYETQVSAIPGLNVRYAVKEAGEALSIYLALICTDSNSYPTQIFFNNAIGVDADQMVAGLLKSVEIKGESVTETREEQEESSERVDLAEEKVAAIITVLKSRYPKGSMGETVTELYRLLGYPDNNSFLNAYGYITGTGASGRPANDPMLIIEELKRRYPNGSGFDKMADLRAANPDIAPKFSNLQNQADKFFGMPFAKYLIQEGILVGKTDDQCGDEFEALKSRYIDKPFTGTLLELKSANDDIDWNAVNRYYSQNGSSDTFKVFLMKQGILVEQETSFEGKLAEITEELKKRYPETKKFSGTLSKLKSDNSDLSLSNINTWTMQVHNLSAQDYLTQQGIMEAPKSVEDKLAAVTETLKERYASGEKKAYTITDLREQNLDLPISTIGTWSKKVFNQNATEYLTEQGVLSEYDWMAEMRLQNERREAEAKAREEKRQAELNGPIKTIVYEPQTYYVEEIKVSGEEAKEWKTAEYWASNPGEIFIEDYLGDKSHVIIPVEIDGKKVSGLSSFAFKQCKAKVVEIPGYFKTISHGFAFQNNNITTAIIGEGVTTIGDSVFFNTPNLENVMVSKSVNAVEGDCAFNSTKWYEKQGDYVIVGTVLMHFKGDGAVVNVPYGVTTISKLVAVFKDIRKVIIPETVTTLRESAFSGRGNENIQEFIFTDSLTNIGLHSFGYNKWTESFGDNPVIINNQL